MSRESSFIGSKENSLLFLMVLCDTGLNDLIDSTMSLKKSILTGSSRSEEKTSMMSPLTEKSPCC